MLLIVCTAMPRSAQTEASCSKLAA
jgi:hypothetical protein